MRNCWKAAFLAALLLVCTTLAVAQVSTSGRLVGSVSDATGAMVSGAEVTVKDDATGATITTRSGTDGTFQVANLRPGSYTVTVTLAGFKTALYQAVKIVVGSIYDLQVKLEVGPVESSVVIEAGADVLETQQTSVSTTITGKAITHLPFTSRDALDLATMMPGVQTTANPRNSSINGLPKGSINITYDGINDQSNLLKSSDGFFTMIRPRTDTIEEFSLTTAGSGAENSEGAAQIKFETKRGGNEYHGGVWWYHRNDFLNANYYFNNLAGTDRQRLRLNQFGYKAGGPIIKERLFFFHAFDFYKKPESLTQTRTFPNQMAQQGFFTYAIRTATFPGTNPNAWTTCDAASNTCTANVLQLAGANGFTSTVDTVVAGILGAMQSSVSAAGVGLLPAPTLFQQSITFNDTNNNDRYFPDLRVDWNITANHQWTGIYHYNDFGSQKDLLNNRGITYPAAPFDQNTGAQLSSRNQWVTAWRWNLASDKSNEVRFGYFTSPSWFAQGLNLGIYPGASTSLGNLNIRPVMNLVGGTPGGGGQPFQTYLPQPRTESHAQLIETFSWTRGKHNFQFGGSWTELRAKLLNGGAAVATVNLGLATSDPVALAGIFGAGPNLPGTATTGANAAASATDAANAGALYGMLAGRVTGLTGNVFVDENTRQFVPGGTLIQRYDQTEFGFYASDSWRVTPTLTANLGLRWEYQGAPRDPKNIAFNLANGYADVFGVSGLNNLFQPGNQPGSIPVFVNNGERSWYDADLNNWAPSVGLAYQPYIDNRFWKALFGEAGKTVIRSGYSISYSREGSNNWLTIAFNNPGFTGAISLTPVAGAPTQSGQFTGGSIQLQSANYPNLLQNPASFVDSFPINPTAGTSVAAFDPNLATPLVHSWTFGIQRELSSNMVFEVRYVGNHGSGLWRLDNINEINIFENGFLAEFNNARANLAACQANSAACLAAQAAAGVAASQQTASSYGNWGLAGQNALPIMTAAFTGTQNTGPSATQANANFRNATRISNLNNGLAGTFANVLATDLTFWSNLISPTAGSFPANFWRANPHARGGAFRMFNGSHSTYNALQLELRRRMAKGLQFNGNYTWSHSISNLFADSSINNLNFTSLRDQKRDKGPSPFDLRHQFKLMAIYEMPFGPGRRWSSGNSVLNRMIEGWELSTITRWQTGRVFSVTGGAGGTVNAADGGVELIGINAQQLQSMLEVRKTATGQVFYFPASLVNGTVANSAFLRPCSTAGAWCQRLFLYGPQFFRSDINVTKRTRISETANVEFRAEFLNAFNNPNFFFGGTSGLAVVGTTSLSATQGVGFGRIVSAYQDVSTTDDPGGRLVQLVLRINF